MWRKLPQKREKKKSQSYEGNGWERVMACYHGVQRKKSRLQPIYQLPATKLCLSNSLFSSTPPTPHPPLSLCICHKAAKTMALTFCGQKIHPLFIYQYNTSSYCFAAIQSRTCVSVGTIVPVWVPICVYAALQNGFNLVWMLLQKKFLQKKKKLSFWIRTISNHSVVIQKGKSQKVYRLFLKSSTSILHSVFTRPWPVSLSHLQKNTPTAWCCHPRASA